MDRPRTRRGAAAAATSEDPHGDAAKTIEDGLRRPQVHGWHVSPYEDDGFTLVPPGARKTYAYHLPKTHPAGTFWYFGRADIPQTSRGAAAAARRIFRGDEKRCRRGRDADIPWRRASRRRYHAHAQGSSSLQVLGMLGALIVLDADHRRLPPDVVLVLTQTNVVAGKSRNYAWASAASGSRVKPLAASPLGVDGDAAALAVKASLKGPPLNATFFAVNGRLRPTLRPSQREWLRWRLIHAGSNDVLVLELDDPTACETLVVARDGYARAAPLRGSLTRDRPLVMAPGSRADVYAACVKPAVLRSRSKGLEAYLGEGSDVYDGGLLRIKPAPSEKLEPPPVLPAAAPVSSLLATPPDRARGPRRPLFGGGAAWVRGRSAATSSRRRRGSGDLSFGGAVGVRGRSAAALRPLFGGGAAGPGTTPRRRRHDPSSAPPRSLLRRSRRSR